MYLEFILSPIFISKSRSFLGKIEMSLEMSVAHHSVVVRVKVKLGDLLPFFVILFPSFDPPWGWIKKGSLFFVKCCG